MTRPNNKKFKHHRINNSEAKLEKVKQEIVKWKILHYKEAGNYIELNDWIKAASIYLSNYNELVRIFENAFSPANK